MHPKVVVVRKRACQRNKCEHDLALCETADANCPNGVWGSPNLAQRRQGVATLNRTHKFPVHLATPKALPRSHWPLWAKALARLASPADTGLGDTVLRTIGPVNSSTFKLWFKSTFGQSCRCNERQEQWNQLYPL